jgi:hypothetical protein
MQFSEMDFQLKKESSANSSKFEQLEQKLEKTKFELNSKLDKILFKILDILDEQKKSK